MKALSFCALHFYPLGHILYIVSPETAVQKFLLISPFYGLSLVQSVWSFAPKAVLYETRWFPLCIGIKGEITGKDR